MGVTTRVVEWSRARARAYHSRSFSRFMGLRCWSERAKKMYSSPIFGGSTQMCTYLIIARA